MGTNWIGGNEMHHNFENADNVDNIENVEKSENPDAKQKESIMDKARNFFAEFGKKKEGNESTGEKSDKSEDTNDRNELNEHDKFVESLRDGRSQDEINKEISDTVKQFNEKNGLDEHGYPTKDWKRPEGGFERELGDDSPRSRWDDSESVDRPETEQNETKKEESSDDE